MTMVAADSLLWWARRPPAKNALPRPLSGSQRHVERCSIATVHPGGKRPDDDETLRRTRIGPRARDREPAVRPGGLASTFHLRVVQVTRTRFRARPSRRSTNSSPLPGVRQQVEERAGQCPSSCPTQADEYVPTG